mgnify:CR=1 FL=1
MKWIYRRILSMIITVFVTINLTFFIVRLMPGNPLDVFVAQQIAAGVPADQAIRIASALFGVDLNKPLHEQYIEYMSNLLRGNLGYSLTFLKTPVVQIIAKAIPWTLLVVGSATLLSFIVGIISGIFLAYKRGTKMESVTSLFAVILSGIPNYIIAILLLYYLGYAMKLFPTIGAYSAGMEKAPLFEFIMDIIWHAALPVLSYFVTSFPFWMLITKGSTTSVLGEDYVAFAKLRGLNEKRIAITYVGRNAILPPLTTLAISLGAMFGGSVLVETLFSYPGMGYYLARSVNGRDYTLMQGIFLVITIAVVISNTIADILYALLDPRVRIVER